MKKIFLITVAMLLLLAGLSGAANEKGSITLTAINEVEVEVINEKGQKEIKRVDAAKAEVVPGDLIIYTIKYESMDTKEVENVTIVNPVPEHTIYRFGSAVGKDTKITFSVDEGKTFDVPSNLFVKDKDGKLRPASASEYTHIKWVLNNALKPKQKGLVSFRAILE